MDHKEVLTFDPEDDFFFLTAATENSVYSTAYCYITSFFFTELYLTIPVVSAVYQVCKSAR